MSIPSPGSALRTPPFIDFFKRGPLDKAVRITSFADFERVFGGLDTRSEASYAIQQFFLNGGSVAWVVRVAAGNFDFASLTLQGGSPLQDTLTGRSRQSRRLGQQPPGRGRLQDLRSDHALQSGRARSRAG